MKNNKFKVLFLSKHSRIGSNIIRGKTVAQKLSSEGVVTSNITYKIFKILKAYYLYKYDVFVFIKRIDLELAKLLKERGKIVVIDTVDNYEFENGSLWSKENKYVDYYIANTKVHQDFLYEKFAIDYKKSFIIEHHHSNLHNVTKKVNIIKTIGFIGEKQQFEKSEKLASLLKKKNLNFYMPDRSPTTNEDAVAETLKLDCFILNLNKELDKTQNNLIEYMIKFKPAQKILLPFSIGIPTVLTPYVSYIEAIESAGYNKEDFLFASNEDELIIQIEKLLNFDTEELNILIEKQKKVASLFTIDEVSKKYIKMFETIYENEF